MYKLLFLLLLISHTITTMQAKTIRIAAIDWCPQLCPKETQDGYVLDIIKEVFKNSIYKIEVQTYPWSRAISMTKNGTVHALLSPAKKEAPNLIYPKKPVGKQQMCFFSTKSSLWEYKSINSLKNKNIGIATDTSIEELNHYIKQNSKQFQYLPYSQFYIKQSLLKLDRKRFDAFLFTKNSTVYKINLLGLKGQYKNVGCVSSANIYIAFTPQKSLRPYINEIIDFFDKKMQKINQTNKIKVIMKSYGLE